METQQEDTCNALRHQNFEDSRPSFTSHPNFIQNAGTKRLFSNRGSRTTATLDKYSNNTAFTEDTADIPLGKRHRTSDWPLTNTSPSNASTARPPLRNRNVPNSPNLRRSSASVPRPSKFVEGSMNDRVSYKPPEPYIGQDEDLLARYGCEPASPRKKMMTLPRKFTHHPNVSVAESAISKEPDASRSSGIFRFGKSLAASFNLSNWKIWQKPHEVEVPEHKLLRERKEKAEKMYQELKASGMFRDATVGQQSYYDLATQLVRDAPGKHDSRVQFGYEERTPGALDEMSKADKRMGRVFLEQPSFLDSQAPECIASNSTEDNEQYVKKLASSIIKNSESPASHHSTAEHIARRIPSRKDMHKQQKLVKRVSNLECKLEAARRQLAEALATQTTTHNSPKAGNPRFIPSGLASLPSERLLSAHARYEGGLNDEQDYEGIGTAVTTDEATYNGSLMLGAQFTSTEPNLDKPLPSISLKSNHADQLIRSVETDDMVEKSDELDAKAAHPKNSHQPSAASEQESSSCLSEVMWNEEEEYEQDHPTPKPKPTLRKRKTTVFESMADDGGIYKPSEIPKDDSTDELDSKPRKFRVKKSDNASRPRKLQKTGQKQAALGGSPIKEPPSTPSTKTTAQNHRQPASRYQGTNNKKHFPAPTPHNPHLVKSNFSERQSHSPPPSCSFTGVKHQNSELKVKENQRTLPNQTFSHHTISHDSIVTSAIPPVPRLPHSERIQTREVINTTASAPGSPIRTSSKLMKTKPVLKGENRAIRTKTQVKEGGTDGRKRDADAGVIREEFEWDEDVF